ncbi:MAG: NADH:ubiquinone oxidoreductase, partial [Alistipes sp.]|nr:NADH:ubiquinone oxidoreductase [Alistipes sp.]
MILPKIKVLRSHGRQAIPDLDAVELTPEFRGRPELTATGDTAELEQAAAICPTSALSVTPFSLALGRCL